MLILSLVLGLGLGLLAGGQITNLASVRLRLVQLLFLGLALRYVTQFAIEEGIGAAVDFRLPLFAGGFLLLLVGLWVNRDHPGLSLAFVGILLNAVAIVTNGGFMPVWEPSLQAAGLTPADVGSVFHKLVGATTDGGIPSDFLAQAGPLGDIIPIPIPFLRNVASIGDVFLATGLAFFLFAITVRHPEETEEASEAAIRRRIGELVAGDTPASPAAGVRVAAGGALVLDGDLPEGFVGQLAEGDAAAAAGTVSLGAGGLVSPVSLERPMQLGGSALGSEGTARRLHVPTLPQVPPILERVRRHPYVRLALDSSFSALWAGQLVSALGDRIHQVALAYVVWNATDSEIAVAAVFVVATLPNLVFGPIAGALIDRWDHREVMIVSDLLRAGIVLLIPLAAVTNLALAYPLVFLLTTVSIFFRPAKVAILPRVVAEEDLLPANSALWVGETFADIAGYVIAGLFVTLLGSQLPLAFWVDSVTYIASAVLIASIAVAPMSRSIAGSAADAASAAATGVKSAVRGFAGEIREGWRFLRGDTVLLANTIQATFAQFMIGAQLALTAVYADVSIARDPFSKEEAYGFIEAAIGAGNLIGGFLIGLIGTRLALGRMVIVGYVATGALMALFAVVGSLPLAIGVAFGTGVGNLAFVIPSQTLFQRRVPAELMGRVLSLRFAVVGGSLALAMGVSGILGELFGPALVIGAFGLVTVAAGLIGALVPAVRDA